MNQIILVEGRKCIELTVYCIMKPNNIVVSGTLPKIKQDLDSSEKKRVKKRIVVEWPDGWNKEGNEMVI